MIICKNTFFPSPAEAVHSLPFDSHKKELPEIKKTCETAQEILSKKSNEQGSTYLKRKLIVNFEDKSYSLLLEKNIFFKEGAAKKVTSAIKVRETENGFTATPYVRIAPKKGMIISENEIAYEKKYGSLEDLTYYEGKDKTQKLTYLQKKYDCDTFEFVLKGYGKEKNYSCEVLNVLQSIGKTVQKMHADNVVHRDIKCLNTFYKHSETENDEVCLGDFGLSYAPLTEEKLGDKRIYGSLLYTAPERLNEIEIKKEPSPFSFSSFSFGGDSPAQENTNTSPKAPDDVEPPKNQEKGESLLEQAKAEDMYAIGCEMYQLIFKKDLPWSSYIDEFIKNPTEYTKKELDGQRGYDIVLLKKSILLASDGPSKDLLLCLDSLLESDPSKRMKIDAFMDKISEISKSLTSESIWIPTGFQNSQEVKLMKIAEK